MLRLASHRYDQGIDTRLFEIRVVYQRRLERMCRKTNVRDQFRVAIDRHVLLSALYR